MDKVAVAAQPFQATQVRVFLLVRHTHLQLVPCLGVLLGGHVIIALPHAAVGYLLQEFPPGVFGELLGVLGNGHLLSHLLSDRQVLGQAKLQGIVILRQRRGPKKGSISSY